MARLLALVSVAGLLFASTGCVAPYGTPAYGHLITQNVRGPVAGVDNAVGQSKTGVAEAKGILFLAQGDASIAAAMANGGITRVHHVDCEVFSILGVYTTYKTLVYGE